MFWKELCVYSPFHLGALIPALEGYKLEQCPADRMQLGTEVVSSCFRTSISMVLVLKTKNLCFLYENQLSCCRRWTSISPLSQTLMHFSAVFQSGATINVRLYLNQSTLHYYRCRVFFKIMLKSHELCLLWCQWPISKISVFQPLWKIITSFCASLYFLIFFSGLQGQNI